MDNSWCKDEHRDRYIHECDKCKQQVLSYRNCTKETHSRECDGKLQKVDFIPLIPYNFKFKKISQPIVGRTFFSPEFGREISTSDINKLCKQNGYVYASDADLAKDCERNKQYNEEKSMAEFRNTVIENSMRELS